MIRFIGPITLLAKMHAVSWCLAGSMLLGPGCSDTAWNDYQEAQQPAAASSPQSFEAHSSGQAPAWEPQQAQPVFAPPLDEHEPDPDLSQPREDANSREGPMSTDCASCADIPKLASRTKYPIILAHGMAGFDEFSFLQYWGGVEERLRSEGFAVYTAVVDPMNGSDIRAGQLALFVDRVLTCTCSEKANIIAHSQGGMDARVLVDAMGYHDRIASVSTVSTPHWGTPVADRLLELVPGEWDPVLDVLAFFVTGLYTDPLAQPEVRSAMTWCSTGFTATFYEEFPPAPSVAWYSYAGRAGVTANGKPECEAALIPNPTLKNALNAPFYPGWLLIGGLQGVDNDGLVPVESAKYGTFLGCIPADHVQEIGMYWLTLPVFDHQGFYLEHALLLEDWGH